MLAIVQSYPDAADCDVYIPSNLASRAAHCTTAWQQYGAVSTSSYPKTEAWWGSDRPTPPLYAYLRDTATGQVYSSLTDCAWLWPLNETSR